MCKIFTIQVETVSVVTKEVPYSSFRSNIRWKESSGNTTLISNIGEDHLDTLIARTGRYDSTYYNAYRNSEWAVIFRRERAFRKAFKKMELARVAHNKAVLDYNKFTCI